MQAQELFLLVSSKLQDLDFDNGQRWPWEKDANGTLPSLIDFLNNGIRQIALNRPDATAITESVQLEVGFRQRIPDPSVHDGASKKAICLLELIQNMGSDGQTRGTPIFPVEMEAIKSYGWSSTGEEVLNYAYDKLTNPQIFYISPSLSAPTYVELTYSAEPDEVSSPTEEIPISEIFSGPLMHWILYEIFIGDNEDSNYVRAVHHLQAFYQDLGIKMKTDLLFPVNKSNLGG